MSSNTCERKLLPSWHYPSSGRVLNVAYTVPRVQKDMFDENLDFNGCIWDRSNNWVV